MAYTGYYVKDRHIYGPREGGAFYISQDYVYGPRNGARFYLGNPIAGARFFYDVQGSAADFYLTDNGHIYSVSGATEPPWLAE
jgi:hypothetical protein